eukprot:4060359-Pleurochrysis_carterae.AAC.1
MKTGKPKAIGSMASIQQLRGRTLVYEGAKLYKPAGEPKSRAMLVRVPPARAVHRVCEDRTESLVLCMNLAILNEVRQHERR